MLIISYLQLALLQPQRVGIVVTTNPENVERRKGIVTKIAIANRVLSAEKIIAQMVFHMAMTAAINHQKVLHPHPDLMKRTFIINNTNIRLPI